MRLALIYALLDSADTIALEHLEACLAVWRYSADSATWVLGDSLGDPTADEIWVAAKESPTGSRVAWKGAAPGQSKASFGRSHPGDWEAGMKVGVVGVAASWSIGRDSSSRIDDSQRRPFVKLTLWRRLS